MHGSKSIFQKRGKYKESDDVDDKQDKPKESESAKWTRKEAQIDITKAQLLRIGISHISFGEKALLIDIEKKDDTPVVGRGGSVTDAEFSSVGRDRSNTEFVHINVFKKAKAVTTWQSTLNRVNSLLDVLTSSGLRQRPRLYMLSFLFVGLMLVADDSRSPMAWFRFYGVVLMLDICTALGDQFFFVFIIDKIFKKNFNILRTFHGPIGLLANLLILTAEGLGQILEVAENFGPWRNYVAGIITVLVCICIKNYYVRQHYVALLQGISLFMTSSRCS